MKISINDTVKVIDGSEWHNLYGVVDMVDEAAGIAFIKCTLRPWDTYWLYLKDDIFKYIEICNEK